MVAAPAVRRHDPRCGASMNMGTHSPGARVAAPECHHSAGPPRMGCPDGGDSVAQDDPHHLGASLYDPPGHRRGRQAGEASDEGEPRRSAAGQACAEGAGVVARAGDAGTRWAPGAIPPRSRLGGGARPAPGGEVFGLSPEDLDTESGVVHVRRQVCMIDGHLNLRANGSASTGLRVLTHCSWLPTPCATPMPASSSKPASRSSPSPAGSGKPTLALLCVHTRTSCPTQAREVAPPWMLGSAGRRTPWKPPDGHAGV